MKERGGIVVVLFRGVNCGFGVLRRELRYFNRQRFFYRVARYQVKRDMEEVIPLTYHRRTTLNHTQIGSPSNTERSYIRDRPLEITRRGEIFGERIFLISTRLQDFFPPLHEY